MKSYIGKRVKIQIRRNEKDLFFTALIIDVNDTHISFIDKFNQNYSFKIKDVQQIVESKV